MKPREKIQIEIYADQAQQFYLSLLKYKFSKMSDIESAKAIADAIHFDPDILIRGLQITETQETKIREKLASLHNQMLKSKKDHGDYLKVSKETFEKFQASEFGKDLFEFFKLMELVKRFLSKTPTAEIKTISAMFSWFITSLAQGIGTAISKGMSDSLNDVIALKEANEKPIRIVVKNGNLFGKGESGENTVELEVFIEKEGQIRRLFIDTIDKIPEIETVSSIFLREKDNTIQIKQGSEPDKIEITEYIKIKVKNNKLDLSNSEISGRMTVPRDLPGKDATMEEDGSLLIHPQKQLPNEIQNPSEIITEGSTSNDINEGIEKGEKTNSASSIVNNVSESTFLVVDEFVSNLFTIPKNVADEVSARDQKMIQVFELLKKHYSDISLHVAQTITGYIAAHLGLLESELRYDNSNRKQNYKKYLRDSVYNTLKRNSRIENSAV